MVSHFGGRTPKTIRIDNDFVSNYLSRRGRGLPRNDLGGELSGCRDSHQDFIVNVLPK